MIAGAAAVVGDGATLRTYDVTTGAPGGPQPFPGMYGVTPAWYADGLVVATDYRFSDSSNSRIDGVDVATGALLWSRDADGFFFAGTLAVGDGAVFVTLYDRLLAIELATGDDRWARGGTDGYRTQPSGADGVLYEYATVHGRRGVLAFDTATR